MANFFETNRRPPEYPNKELMNLAGEESLLYTKEVLPGLRESVLARKGLVVVRGVKGRLDDDEIEVDSFGEIVRKKLLKREGYPIRAYSEHSTFGVLRRDAKILSAGDPLDNTSQLLRDLPTSVFNCHFNYDLDGNPLSGSIIDIRLAMAYLSLLGKNCVVDNFLEGSTPRSIHKSERTSIKDPRITIASYTGSPEYALKFYTDFDEKGNKVENNFARMVRDMDRKGRTYADGGAFIYALLASGAVDAYVMRDEPNSEIAAGAGFAQVAGCTLWCVDKKGNIEDWKFDPRKFRQNVYLFIAAGTQKLAKEIYDYYFKYKDEVLVA